LIVDFVIWDTTKNEVEVVKFYWTNLYSRRKRISKGKFLTYIRDISSPCATSIFIRSPHLIWHPLALH